MFKKKSVDERGGGGGGGSSLHYTYSGALSLDLNSNEE